MINYYSANNSRNTTIKANSAIASVSANPNIAILNSSSFKLGFLAIPKTSAPKTVPIPTPAPASPMVASPAPMYLAACSNNTGRYGSVLCLPSHAFYERFVCCVLLIWFVVVFI
jgi:hypothetical protein